MTVCLSILFMSLLLVQFVFALLDATPTGAIESEATTLEEIIQETLKTVTSERQGRAIDSEKDASMEFKKQ